MSEGKPFENVYEDTQDCRGTLNHQELGRLARLVVKFMMLFMNYTI
jgi:hypothetical protein